MSLRWRIALGFALVALATAAVIALATPPIVTQGFSDVDLDNDAGVPASSAASQATVEPGEDSIERAPPRPGHPQLPAQGVRPRPGRLRRRPSCGFL